MHFLRNLPAQVLKGSAETVAAAIRTVFAQPNAERAREELDTIASMLCRQFPKVETMLREAAPDITAGGTQLVVQSLCNLGLVSRGPL